MAINPCQYYQPDEILLRIFGYLSIQELSVTKQVCTRFFRIARDPSLYVGALDSLRLHFPLVAGRDDGLNLNTYQKALRCAKRICIYNAKTTGRADGTNNAFIDAKNVEPHDQLILQALKNRRDHDLYQLCKRRLSSDPKAIVETLLHTIVARNGRYLTPQLNMDWMLVYSLKRYIEEMPRSCVKELLNSLNPNDTYALVAYLYPLRVNLKVWWRSGLDLELVNSNGKHLVHLVMNYIDHIEWRCGLDRLDQLVPEAAFTDGRNLVTSLAKSKFLSRVSSLIQKQPHALPCDIASTQKTVDQLTKEFQQLGGRNTPELVKVAVQCDNLVRSTQTVARSQANRKRGISNPNESSRVLKRVKREVLEPHIDEAIEDLKFLRLHGKVHSPDGQGMTADQIARPNRRRYSQEHLEKITQIFDPPCQSSQ